MTYHGLWRDRKAVPKVRPVSRADVPGRFRAVVLVDLNDGTGERSFDGPIFNTRDRAQTAAVNLVREHGPDYYVRKART